MAKAYREYKVSELKEMLTKRNLATSGTKPELIARLEASEAQPEPKEDEAKDEAKDGAKEAKDETKETKDETSQAETTAKPTAQPTEPTEPTAPTSDPQPTSESEPAVDPTQVAIKDLEKRIERMRRFGEPTEELEQQLKRIQRFGYTPPPKASKGNFRNKRRNNRPVKVTK